MKLKKLLALGLTSVMLIASVSACGNSEEKGTTSPKASETAASAKAEDSQTGKNGGTDSPVETTAEANTTSGDASANGGPAYNVDWDDTADIKVVLIAPGPVPSGLQEVEDALNEITEAEIDTHVTLEMLEMGNYIQQLSLKMSSSEQVDLVMTFPGGSATFAAMQNQGQLMDITKLLSDYAQPVLDTVGEYIKATTVDGKIYGVPIYRDYSSGVYAVMRTDVLEDLGLTEQAENMTCLEDFGKILEAVKSSEKWGSLTGLATAAGNGTIAYMSGGYMGLDSNTPVYVDNLGTELLQVDATGKDTQVRLVAETEAYKKLYEFTHNWYAQGYIFKDAATSQETAYDLIKADKCFGVLMNGELGIKAQSDGACQMPMTCVKLISLPVSTNTCTMFTWAIPTTAKYPEAAATFMSMMYTSPEVNDLMAWGIEGRDYVLEDGIANYPDGNADVPYHSADYMAGNQFLVTPWAGQGADIRQKSADALSQATVSAYLGFTCNTDAIMTELSALNNVVAEFGKQINTGVADPQVLDEYIAKLNASGVEKVVAEYQNQLNAWLESNK